MDASGLQSAELRVSLAALRDVLIERLAEAKPAESAALSRVLGDVLVKLDGLPGEEKSNVDDLAAVRAARRAGVQDGSRSGVERG